MRYVSIILDRAHAALSHDFCPWANRWVYWLKQPLAAVLLAATVALICGLLVNPSALIVLAAAALIGCLGIVWPLIAVRGLRCEAEFLSSRCRVGEAIEVRIRLRNRWPWPLWGLSVRRGFTDPGDESAGIALARVAAWSETEWEWTFRPHRRGVFPTERPQIDTGFPFGLIHARAPVDVTGELVVWPRSIRLDAMPDTVEIRGREDRLTDRRAGDLGDFLGTRAFRDGDSLRRVHWGQTARFGRMIVTEREAPVACAVQLRIDTAASVHRIANGSSSLERVLTVAASILESLHRQHARIDVVMGTQTFAAGSGSGDLRRCLDAIARVPEAGDPSGGSECTLDRLSRHTSTIAVTTDLALRQHVAHQHRSSRARYVVVRTDAGSSGRSAEKTVEGCDCHAWVELAAGDPVEMILPESWRRACHVA
ncbi:hypothetical protein Mal4_23240 [Maioricimonas rarisocia]|uniref:DUF58 domain-containing protein n=1 Tax=Maioricimonas rarisocia TaxID=2528026 RepID=A0A517Z6B3_9PLAN|nr:DUF58 domain-containing protein [Maioricimonas rarisocia]QDU38004.1 hypothetical protein Mal4_23240 [Maioricimonas rarisocia]